MKLEDQLKGRPFEQIPIKVTSGVLLHIGAGIYNSVAGALKELVSNSFDADAKRVVISTDYPKFQQIKVVDNGLGMTPAYLTKAMQSIGSTLKGIMQPNRLSPVFKRPIIGHLGIGLMSLTQVCDEAIIESQATGSKTKFLARLDFSEFKKNKKMHMDAVKLEIFCELAERYGGIDKMKQQVEKLDQKSDNYNELLAQVELATEAEKLFKEQGMKELEGEHLGYCVIYPNLPAVPSEQGTIITLNKLEKGVQILLMDKGRSRDAMPQQYKDRDIEWDKYRDEINNWPWRELCKRLQTKTSQLTYQSLPQYHQFIWDLSIMTPVQYIEQGPVLVEPDLSKKKKEELNRFNFDVIIDNRSLLKPILLPSGALACDNKLERGFDYYLKSFNQNENIDGDLLKYDGYIFWQRNQIQPSVMRGIQIYIRNVGVGLYDQTLMGFSVVNPTSRAGQISGEIYIEEGLERALNVDRNSFRETDAHFIALQEHLWKLLGSGSRGKGIIGMSVDAYWKRKERLEKKALKKHIKKLMERVRLASNDKFVLEFSDENNPHPYGIKDHKITIYDGSPSWPRSSSLRHLYQQVLVPIRVAIEAGSSVKQLLAILEENLLKQ